VYSNSTSSGEEEIGLEEEDESWATRPEITRYFNEFFPNLSLKKRKERLVRI
jgi:hypothetical protein